MSASRPLKRRKEYLDRDKFFQVPVSSLYKRLKDHAAAASNVASTSRCNGDDSPASAETSASCFAHSDDDDNDGANGSAGTVPCSSASSSTHTRSDDEQGSSEDSSEESDGFEEAQSESGDNRQFSGFSVETLPGSQVTKAGAIAAVMAYAIAHGLTWTALGDLSKLINFLFGASVLPRSEYMFRKLWSNEAEEVLRYYYVCETCSAVMTPQGKMAQCQICEHTERLQALKEQGSFFIILDFHKQLSFLIEKTKSELESSLVKARLPASKISDITNARCYAKLKKARSLADDDLTLTINTDGSPVFKSSKTSVWPIQFIVNELPPHLRFKHPVLAGLWFGKSHPNMQLFLDKFVQEVNSTKPVTWTYQNRVHTSRPFVLCCSVDAPARAAVLNMVPFNGYFGCPWCLIRGEHVEGSMRYVTDEPVEARTSDLVRRDMKMALDYKDVINGVKGPSALMNLKGLDLVNGQSVEYMHCVLQGVSKQLTEAILTSTNSNQRFYVGAPSVAARIESRLLAIKPPHCVTRLPRPLKDRGHWKASEWRQWILFYALPCLDGILHPEYWKHLSRLSEGIHILLQEELGARDIDRAEALLSNFVCRCKTLYGTAFMTFNVHALQHLANCARSLGPLWAHSAFVFEGGNGSIVRLVSAANGLPRQITERVIMAQKLNQLIESPLLSIQERELCNEFIGYPPIKKALHVCNLTLLGKGKVTALSANEQDKLHHSCGISITRAVEYERFIMKKQVFHSTAYQRATKSDTRFIRTNTGCYKCIEKIFFVKEADICALFCRPLIIADATAVPPHIKECFLSPDRNLDLLLPEEVADTCMYINFTNEGKTFICDLPNKIERD
ncbi:uncharacterized protein [Dermacentor andersoni]|uniref:uncharacterized protein n=1 Tax=Dermacentor andersoni TaxID=34620 RepID=UPI0021558F14|nr:uncharacterized protein LOC126531125 [Dermacentor andersoni]